MRTPGLFNLGCALLAFGVGSSALAEDPPAAAASEAAAAVVVEVADAIPAEPLSDPLPQAMPEAVVAADSEVVETPQAETPEDAMDAVAADLSVAEDIAATQDRAAGDAAADVEALADVPAAASEAIDPAATDMPASEPSEFAPATETASMQLGAVGYDDQGREGRIHVVSPGDTLWDISDGYLGTPWVWPSIWHDNQAIENPHLIFPGDRIWITPWEMRKLTASEADAMLAGKPAAAEGGMANLAAPNEVPPPAAVAPAAEMVPQEQLMVTIPNRERIGLVSADVVDASASLLANVAPRLMISQNDRVWIGLAEGETRPGAQFTIFRIQDKVYDPESGRMMGYHVAQLGWLEVIETHDESSLAIVRISNSEIEVGDKLLPRVAIDSEIAVTSPAAGVEGQISFLPQSRTHMGTLDLVYLNRGVLDGVDVGTPLEVFRKGFSTRDEVLDQMVQVPDRPVAHLLVVRAQDEVSVAVIRATQEELQLGDYFRGATN